MEGWRDATPGPAARRLEHEARIGEDSVWIEQDKMLKTQVQRV
jgi:hypothetical protein